MTFTRLLPALLGVGGLTYVFIKLLKADKSNRPSKFIELIRLDLIGYSLNRSSLSSRSERQGGNREFAGLAFEGAVAKDNRVGPRVR